MTKFTVPLLIQMAEKDISNEHRAKWSDVFSKPSDAEGKKTNGRGDKEACQRQRSHQRCPISLCTKEIQMESDTSGCFSLGCYLQRTGGNTEITKLFHRGCNS